MARKRQLPIVPEWLRREGLGAFFGSESAIRAIAAQELAARRVEQERLALAMQLEQEKARLKQEKAVLAIRLEQERIARHAASESYIRACSIDGVTFIPLSRCESAGATDIWTVMVAASSNAALTRPFDIYFKSGSAQVDEVRTVASYHLDMRREQAAETHLSSVEYLGASLIRVSNWRRLSPQSNKWECDVRRQGENDSKPASFEIQFSAQSDEVDASKTFVDFGRAYGLRKARETAAEEFFQRFQARGDKATRISTWSCSPAGDKWNCNFAVASQPEIKRVLSITFMTESSRIGSVHCADSQSGHGWYPIPFPIESFSDTRDFARQPKLRYVSAGTLGASEYEAPTSLSQVCPSPVDVRWVALSARASGRDEAYLFSVKALAFESLSERMLGHTISNDAAIWRLRLSVQNLGSRKLPSREWKTTLLLVDNYGREFRPVHDSSLAVDPDTGALRIARTATSRLLAPQTVVNGYVIFLLPHEPTAYWLTARDVPC